MRQLLILLGFIAALSLADARIGFGSLQPRRPKGSRIIGGTNAKLGEFPWQASLQIVPNDGSDVPFHYCGGSILTPNTILTAGHCITEVFVDPDFEHIQIQVGLINTEEPGKNVQTRLVVNSTVHPDFIGGVAPNDLAIHILDEPLELNEFVQPLNLPKKDAVPTGQTILSGWGSTGLVYPAELKRVDLPIVPYKECAEALDGLGTPFEDTMVCTGPLTGGSGACSGDSGGALIQPDGDSATQVGIVSWGFIPCGQEGRPSVFTRVSNFISWINENTVN